jgi:hypothetical protein
MKRSISKPQPARASAVGVPSEMPPTRQQRLREALPATVDCLHRRRADMIEDGFIDDYVALHWLEWHGGSLRLTITGTNVCQQVAAQANS